MHDEGNTSSTCTYMYVRVHVRDLHEIFALLMKYLPRVHN